MSKNTSIVLGDHFDEFVARKVSDGRFSSASEAVRAGMRLLEEHETKLEALRQAVDQGFLVSLEISTSTESSKD